MCSVFSLSIQPLSFNKCGKLALFIDEFLIGAFLHDMTFFQHDDSAAILDGGESMGDHHTGAVQAVQRLHCVRLCKIVQG